MVYCSRKLTYKKCYNQFVGARVALFSRAPSSVLINKAFTEDKFYYCGAKSAIMDNVKFSKERAGELLIWNF